VFPTSVVEAFWFQHILSALRSCSYIAWKDRRSISKVYSSCNVSHSSRCHRPLRIQVSHCNSVVVYVRINAKAAATKKGMCEITDGRWGSGDQDDGIKVELTYHDVSPPLCTNGGSKALHRNIQIAAAKHLGATHFEFHSFQWPP